MVVGGVVVFVVAVLLHGLVIWDGPVERVAALLVAAGTMALLWQVWRSGVLAGRAVVELRRDRRISADPAGAADRAASSFAIPTRSTFSSRSRWRFSSRS
ncbi:hypothetical protein D3C83_72260 [compost metagenome]